MQFLWNLGSYQGICSQQVPAHHYHYDFGSFPRELPSICYYFTEMIPWGPLDLWALKRSSNLIIIFSQSIRLTESAAWKHLSLGFLFTLFSMHSSLMLFLSWLYFQAKTFRLSPVARLGESPIKRWCWNFPWTHTHKKKELKCCRVCGSHDPGLWSLVSEHGNAEVETPRLGPLIYRQSFEDHLWQGE